MMNSNLLLKILTVMTFVIYSCSSIEDCGCSDGRILVNVDDGALSQVNCIMVNSSLDTVLDGYSTFYKNEVLNKRVFHRKNKAVGPEYSYYDSNENLMKSFKYKNGAGELITYHEYDRNGSLIWAEGVVKSNVFFVTTKGLDNFIVGDTLICDVILNYPPGVNHEYVIGVNQDSLIFNNVDSCSPKVLINFPLSSEGDCRFFSRDSYELNDSVFIKTTSFNFFVTK